MANSRISAHNWKILKSRSSEGNEPENHVGNIIYVVGAFQCQSHQNCHI